MLMSSWRSLFLALKFEEFHMDVFWVHFISSIHVYAIYISYHGFITVQGHSLLQYLG